MASPTAWLATIAIALAVPRVAAADASDERRALVMLRVLAYDKNLDQRVGEGELRIMVAYGDEADSARWTAAFGKVKKVKVEGRTLVVSALRVDSATGLGQALQALRPGALIACDGLVRKIGVGKLVQATRAAKVLSITTREPEVTGGLAIGIVAGKQRDEIVINAGAAAAEGVKFDAGLLALARAPKEQP